jgi:hypothetical protein
LQFKFASIYDRFDKASSLQGKYDFSQISEMHFGNIKVWNYQMGGGIIVKMRGDANLNNEDTTK